MILSVRSAVAKSFDGAASCMVRCEALSELTLKSVGTYSGETKPVVKYMNEEIWAWITCYYVGLPCQVWMETGSEKLHYRHTFGVEPNLT